MAVRPILTLPDPMLRLRSEPVAAVTDEVRALSDDMLDTMYHAPGIGLAAIQVGVPRRLVVIDLAKKDGTPSPIVLVNPRILQASQEGSVYEEGCLSIPDYYEEVERPARVTVGFLDRDGAQCTLEADGLLAVCIQHEVDHLDGVLFIDHISRLKRERVRRKFAKLAKRDGD